MKKLQYDFEVAREPLRRLDGTPTEYDAIYRKRDGVQLAVVSKDYQLVTHREAVGFVEKLGEHWGQQVEWPVIETSNQGKRLWAKANLPGLKFRVLGEDYFPQMVVGNAIDKTRSFTLDFGLFKLICSNGARVLVKSLGQIQLTHYQQNINFKALEEELTFSLDTLKLEFKNIAGRLQAVQVSRKGLRELLTSKDFPVGFRAAVAHDLQEQKMVHFEWITTSNIQIPDPSSITMDKSFDALTLWNILTRISTHEVQSAAKRAEIEQAIAHRFITSE